MLIHGAVDCLSMIATLTLLKAILLSRQIVKQEKLVWSLLRRSNGDIWSTNQDGYIYIYHASTNTTEKLHDPVFENITIRQIAEGQEWRYMAGHTSMQ